MKVWPSLREGMRFWLVNCDAHLAMTPTLVLWQKRSSRAKRDVFAFISPPAEQKWAPHFYCPPTPTPSLGKTITRLTRVWSHWLLSQEEPEASHVSRKEETNNVGWFVAISWRCRATVCKSTELASSLSYFSPRRLIIIIFCTRDWCRTVHCEWKTPCCSSCRLPTPISFL